MMGKSVLFVLSQSPAASDVNMQAMRIALAISGDVEVNVALWGDAVHLLQHDHSSPFYNFKNQYKFLLESDAVLTVRQSDLTERGFGELSGRFPVTLLSDMQFAHYVDQHQAFFI
jgi:sulfur relay (sulfurtransferase) DsrF/TusC family protein